MNIQIYAGKKNPDTLKAERFFKERRIPYQLVDLKKHRLGLKELTLFAKAVGGAVRLVDRAGMKALERPVAHMSSESLILSELMNDPLALVCPIVRNGNQATIGADEAEWQRWVDAMGG
jgi:arsenate reductase-like glutaredoxin family protein